MKYVVVFGLLGGYLLSLALLIGGWALVLLWPAGSFLVLASAYSGLGPRVFGKRSNGRLSGWALVVLGPVLGLLWGLWHLQRWLSREPACHEVGPGLWLGRRPLRHELPANVMLVVDLTSEFPVARGIRHGRDYLTLPTLDGIAPPEPAFRALVERVLRCPGPVYVHCAAGHGRSATLAAAVLLRRGVAANVREAENQLRRIRPGVRLKPIQRRLLERIHGEEEGTG